MGNYTDIVETIFKATTVDFESGMNRMQAKMDQFNSKLNKGNSMAKFNAQLEDIGLSLGRNGQFYSKNKKGAIGEAKALDLVYKRQQQIAQLQSERKAFVAMPEGMKELQQFQQMGTQLGTMQKQGINVNAQLAEMKTRLAGDAAGMSAFSNGIKQGAKSFDMFNLSLMFGGMMLQRAGMAVVRFMIPAMDKLEELNTAGAKEVMGLSAAFEFLKISLFDTISSMPLFEAVIAGLIDLVLWIAEFTQEHPNITLAVAALGAFAAVVGTGFLIAGGWGQIFSMFVGGWASLTKLIGTTGTGGKIGTALTGWKTMLGGLGVAATLAITWDLFANEDDLQSRILSTFGFALGGAMIGAMFGPIGAAAGLVIGLGVGFGLSITDWLMEDQPNMDDFWTAFKSMFGTIGGFLEHGGGLTNPTLWIPLAVKFTMRSMGATDERGNIEGQIASGEDAMAAAEAAARAEKALESIGSTTQEVSDFAVQSYASIFAEQLGTTEQTQELIDNTTNFGEVVQDVFGGDTGIISQFYQFGQEVLQDQEYFETLRNDIENWVSTETVKVITVRYQYENTNEDSGGFIERTGRALIGAITT